MIEAQAHKTEQADHIVLVKALSNSRRFQILEWLTEPKKHFQQPSDTDLVEDGVNVGRLAEKSGLSQPTVTVHMKLLSRAGFVSSKKIKNGVYYSLNRESVENFLALLSQRLTER